MSTATDENLPRVVIDTNILLSAIGFGGKPAEIILLMLDGKIQAITSPILLAELEETLSKILPLSKDDAEIALDEIKSEFRVIQPRISLNVSRDKDDNRVLEVAVAGDCQYIITGDKDLLDLGKYRKIKILTADQFLTQITS